MNWRFIDWIWRIRGSVALAPAQSADQAFDRLDPLFRETGTSHDRDAHELTFRKKDQAAQDKMSIFDHGTLRIQQRPSGAVLRYDLSSRALLFCFLAPLLFVGVAQLTIAIGKHEAARTEAAKKDGPKVKKPDVPMNPIDKALGAPAPEKPDKKKDGEKAAGGHKKASPTSAYVFAGIFAALYVGGRILEDRLINRLFRKRLAT